MQQRFLSRMKLSGVALACAYACASASVSLFVVACPTDPAPPTAVRDPGPGGPGPGGPGPGGNDPFEPADARMRRLLSWQYENAIKDILGTEAAAVLTPPDDVPLNGFVSVGSATLSLSPTDVERIETSAFAAAAEAVHGASSSTQSWRTCTPAAFDDAGCASQIIANVGRKIFRRPLEADELTRWSGVAAQGAAAYGDFDMGLEFAIAGMLQSPHFVYLVEVGTPVSGTDAATTSDPAARRLTGYEMAARLSFFLSGTTPSDALLDAAAAGELDTREGVRLWATTLLTATDGKPQEALRRFFDEKLGLSLLPALDRPEQGYDDTIKAAMREETLRFIDDVVWTRNADARELFTSDTTFLNDPLAEFYGLPLPGSGADFTRVTLPETSKRGGLFTQGAFLSRFAHEFRSAPTLRGKFIRESVLCQAVPAPPDDVNTTLPEPTEQDIPQTTRDRMGAHVSEESCAACHLSMDPIGFAYEEFDQVGRFRTHEVGLPVNAATDLDGVPVNGPREMAAAIAEYPDVGACLVRNLFRQGAGHIEEIGEDPSVFLVASTFEDNGFRLQDALLEIAVSDAFRLVAQPEGAQ